MTNHVLFSELCLHNGEQHFIKFLQIFNILYNNSSEMAFKIKFVANALENCSIGSII
jgi:hypothetical protein